ncbi:hypothetical protein ACFL0W_05620 [Nanoarchaeota archaeon]
MSGKKQVFSELNQKKNEISLLRADLNNLAVEKDRWFKKRDTNSKRIKVLIEELRSSKKERDKFTQSVKDTKQRRRELNEDIKKKIDEIKILRKETDAIKEKHNLKGDPSKLQSEIKKVEFTIETVPMGIEKEKKMMKLLKEKKKAYKQFEQISDVFDKIHKLSKDIDQIREKADKSHKKVQDNANKSQEKHEDFVSSCTDIDELRRLEKEAHEKFILGKKEFTAVNDYLKARLKELGSVIEKVSELREKEKAVKEKSVKQRLKEKEREVEKKLRERKKITTEDLIAMQGFKR